MILSYKASVAGPSHIANNIPCQDACAVKTTKDNIVIAACADGIGSGDYSDIGAHIAVSEAVKYCAEHINKNMDEEEIENCIKNAFVEANKAVITRSIEDGNDEEEYDTTLCLAVYADEILYYGQAGDSGMIALLESGEYIKVTTSQRDKDGYVYPLCFGEESWVFGKVEKPISSVMLATDGLLDELCPPSGKNLSINTYLTNKFMNHFNITKGEIPDLEEKVYRFLEKYPMKKIKDDKTFIVLIDTEHKPQKAERKAEHFSFLHLCGILFL